MTTTTENTLAYIRNLAETGFWGFVTVKMENGHAVHLRREENLKPSKLSVSQLPEKNRSYEYEPNTNN